MIKRIKIVYVYGIITFMISRKELEGGKSEIWVNELPPSGSSYKFVRIGGEVVFGKVSNKHTNIVEEAKRKAQALRGKEPSDAGFFSWRGDTGLISGESTTLGIEPDREVRKETAEVMLRLFPNNLSGIFLMEWREMVSS